MAIKTVLVVDDENVIRLTLSLMFKKLGVTAFVAENGVEAVTQYSENSETIDLVILDFNMPDISGTELFEQLKRINPSIHAVLCSGFISEEDIETFQEMGFDRVLYKPLSLADISSLIE